jgi:hypothetical protein
VLAHFTERKGVNHYRPTAHDEKKLALLQEDGYSQEEVLAAIDLAFDTHPPDAPPIRMFSYCATIALATSPRRLSTTEIDTGSTGEPDGDPASPSPGAASGKPDTPSVLQYVVRLYESEIDAVTPLVEDELRTLVARHPDPTDWDAAFREAVGANVRQLRYVRRVLQGRAARASSNLPPSGGKTDAKRRSKATQPQRGRSGGGHRRRATSPRRIGPTTEEELVTAQQRAVAMEPLDLVAVLGTADA